MNLRYVILLAYGLFSSVSPLSATTVIVKLEKDRILIAADSREAHEDPGPGGTEASKSDDEICKIHNLGSIAFGVAGLVEYKRSSMSDELLDWSAYSDASSSHDVFGDRLRELAADWAKRSVAHYAEFYRVAPARVSELASHSQNILEVAFFTGWDDSLPVLVAEIIYFDNGSLSLSPVSSKEMILAMRDSPYSTNGITQELIDGSTSRSQSATSEWDTASKKVPQAEVDWRHLEFLIKKTSEYDEGVSPQASILSIPFGKSPTWIQRGSCKASLSVINPPDVR